MRLGLSLTNLISQCRPSLASDWSGVDSFSLTAVDNNYSLYIIINMVTFPKRRSFSFFAFSALCKRIFSNLNLAGWLQTDGHEMMAYSCDNVGNNLFCRRSVTLIVSRNGQICILINCQLLKSCKQITVTKRTKYYSCFWNINFITVTLHHINTGFFSPHPCFIPYWFISLSSKSHVKQFIYGKWNKR